MIPAYELKETLLKVEGVWKSYGSNIILRDMNLEVKNIVRPDISQGQVVGLLGPSGIGKTTLFKILSGMEEPDAGTICVNDSKPIQRGMVGVVAQHYPLFNHRTVMGNLLVAGKQAHLSGAVAKEKAINLMTRFGMEEHLNKYPVQLSGGQRQRAAIAQQFMCSEHYLLMDEPFSGLDPAAKDRVVEFISEIACEDEFNTFIVVTHDIYAALEVADTIMLLGRDRDANGNIIPGAKVKATYNLVERGLAWQKNVSQLPEFSQLFNEIKSVFPKL